MTWGYTVLQDYSASFIAASHGCSLLLLTCGVEPEPMSNAEFIAELGRAAK